VEVLGLDHIDLTVCNLERSTDFYELVLGALGFSRVEHPAYTAWSNGRIIIGLREANPEHRAVSADRFRPGLHHLALRAKSRSDVDEFHALLVARGLSVLDPPAEYPEYGPSYYAVFFADPDAMKLEFVHFPWGYWRRVQTEGHDGRPRYALRS
jgi:catechol 2,3-dioxygenase-like lactoylglutathione lyase family enzyme